MIRKSGFHGFGDFVISAVRNGRKEIGIVGFEELGRYKKNVFSL